MIVVDCFRLIEPARGAKPVALSAIGNGLAKTYATLISEPLPDALASLVRKFEAAEAAKSERNDPTGGEKRA
jgi:hypothetical protein